MDPLTEIYRRLDDKSQTSRTDCTNAVFADVAGEVVLEIQQKALKDLKTVMGAFRFAMDGKSAVTAARTGDARQAVAIAKVIGRWKEHEVELRQLIQSAKAIEEARDFVLSYLARREKNPDFKVARMGKGPRLFVYAAGLEHAVDVVNAPCTRFNLLEESVLDCVIQESGAKPPVGDGPIAPDGFRWNGKEYRGLSKKPFFALRFLWDLPCRCAEFPDLAEPVWQDHEFTPDRSNAGTIRRELNKFFEDNHLPWISKVSNGSLCLLEHERKTKRKK